MDFASSFLLMFVLRRIKLMLAASLPPKSNEKGGAMPRLLHALGWTWRCHNAIR